MQVIDNPSDMRKWVRQRRLGGTRIGVVPTMGALHAGHMSLFDLARQNSDAVVATIFVNPMQFNDPSDFEAYPQPLAQDLAACEATGVEAVYAPSAATMYPDGPDAIQTPIDPGPLGELWEGAARPGHFRGVVTVVSKLFHATEPDIAVFGQKDYQQLAIIRRMVRDLSFGVEIIAAPTAREESGLAMSSRNARLSPADRAAAGSISHGLVKATEMAANGETNRFWLVQCLMDGVRRVRGSKLEYAALADANTLEPMKVFNRDAVALVAANVGGVRLIDNALIPYRPAQSAR
jgi:pantoate--beta-alanine ligase